MIDTSSMSAGKKAAFELTEQAREEDWSKGSYVRDLFLGKISTQRLFPYPSQSNEDIETGRSFLQKLESLLKEKVHPDQIDQDGIIPEEVMQGLKDLGAFGIKIPKDYGGLGLSQMNYLQTFIMLGSYCSNISTILSVHQSVGVPQPLLLFGSDEQKRKYLPRVASGELSAFALTEEKVGSDPARMETVATKSVDGSHYILQGEKLWCSNGPIASIMVVAAKTGSGITTFIVEANSPGISVPHRCSFMGLKALSNGIIRFDQVKVPAENILLGEGKGLRVALTTLNTGRLAIAGSALGLSKQCLAIARQWSCKRVQWGSPLNGHQAIQSKLAEMASLVYSMESMLSYTSILVDQKNADIRLEAAMCKMWCTESAWKIVNHTMQILGGRGYESTQSLKDRGAIPYPVERFLRDSRITTIFEGSSEIMRLLIARESLDYHFKKAEHLLNHDANILKKTYNMMKVAPGYIKWFFSLYSPKSIQISNQAATNTQMKSIEKNSRRLARAFFSAMLKHREKLEHHQVLLHHLVDIGTELFAQSVVVARSHSANDDSHQLVSRQFCRSSQHRIDQHFREMNGLKISDVVEISRKLSNDELLFLESGLVNTFH